MPKKKINFNLLRAPSTMVVWKKACMKIQHGLLYEKSPNTFVVADNHCLVRLSINRGTQIRLQDGTHSFSSHNKKCRAEKAKVLGFFCKNTGKRLKNNIEVTSDYDRTFFYKVGHTIKPKRKFNNSRKICAGGIHFFLNKKDAEEYELS